MCRDGTGGSISNIGFQFLLKDVTAQMWDLLYAYITFADVRSATPLVSTLTRCLQSRGLSKKEVLWFLFQMSFLTAGAVRTSRSRACASSNAHAGVLN